MKLDKSFLVYEGKFFTVEFYYLGNGKIEVWDYFFGLSINEKADFFLRIQRLADSNPATIHPKSIFNLEDKKHKIWAIKFNNNRFCIFFYKDRKIIITNAYKKQSQKNRNKENNQILKAVQMKLDYIKRVEMNCYYKKEGRNEK